MTKPRPRLRSNSTDVKDFFFYVDQVVGTLLFVRIIDIDYRYE